MTRLHGRLARGTRCLERAPNLHRQTATFIAALRHDRLCAPWLIDGPIDGVLFRTSIEQVLAQELLPGDLIIRDNLFSHKVSGIAQAIEQCGACLLCLPAYSPDLTPIRMASAKLKAAPRSAALTNFDGLLSALASPLDSLSPLRCQSFFRHAFYATLLTGKRSSA
jgi:transposase